MKRRNRERYKNARGAWARLLLLCASIFFGLAVPSTADNDYYTFENPFTRGSLVRAESVNAQFLAVEAGFDALPALSDVTDTYADDTGSANVYAVELTPAPVVYSSSTVVEFKAANANTGASSLNVNALGVKSIKRYDGSALQSGDIVAGQIVRVRYDGTNFKLIGVHGADVTAAAGSATAAAGSASSASAQAAAASSSATSAAASASSASTQASNATTSASAASTSATNASNSASTASTQASNASTSATNAANSASSASTSATNASNSASAAQAAQAAAEAAAASSVPTGMVMDYVGSSAPSGWLLLDGKTIGDASSGATGRANADTSALFTLLWNSMANGQAAVSGGRGANAAADFAAHKTITIPDARGRVIAADDDMGGSAANRVIGSLTGSVDGDTLGASGGEEGHTLTLGQMPSHTHTIAGTNIASAFGTDAAAARPAGGSSNSFGTGSAGSGQAANTMQPTLILNKIVKL